MKRPPHVVGIVLSALLLLALPVRAADRYSDLQCWAVMTVSSASIPPTNRSSGIDWADQAVDQTAAGSGTATQSWGFEFESPGSPPPEIQCTWIVPETFNQGTGAVPQVTLMGWSIDSNGCLNDSTSRYAKFAVTSRPYTAGDVANDAWPTEAQGTWTFACESNGCGSGIPCRRADVVKSLTLDATSSATNWADGDLVFFRIRRVSVTDDLSQTVHVPRVRLRWPSE